MTVVAFWNDAPHPEQRPIGDVSTDGQRIAQPRCRCQCETTSTSPSTPLTTLKGRSYTLPSFLAMARYSPSAKITRGKAPIDSLMTSPPGVLTAQEIFARPPPPFSLPRY